MTALQIAKIAEALRFIEDRDVVEVDYRHRDGSIKTLSRIRFGRLYGGQSTTRYMDCVDDGEGRSYDKACKFEVVALTYKRTRWEF
jgi:hypothetical protein